MDVAARIDPERGWLAVVGTTLAALVVGAVLLPGAVYDRFLWRYFWGPVVADANSAVCAVRSAGGTTLLGSEAACAGATGVVAYPGYTAVSEVGYAATLLVAVFGVVLLLRRLEVGDEPRFFFALVPFMFLGGALRVVEDANDAVPAGTEAAISYPANTLIISPVIYFTMFVLALGTLVVSVWLERSDRVEQYEYPLAAAGTAGLVAVLSYLGWLAVATDHVAFYPQIAAVVLVATTAIAAAVWMSLERGAPSLLAGVGSMGAVVVWAHTLDGVANVVGIDWAAELTGGRLPDLVPKHPVNRALIDFGERFPEAVTSVVGTAWPFLLVKIAAAVLVVYIFDEAVMEDGPRFSILLLVAIVAVGLGPGTRDMLRATFGI